MDLGITPVVSAVDVAVDEVGAEIALGAAKEALAAAGVNTGKSKQLQRHNRESSSSAFPLAISVQTRSSGIAAGRL